MKITQYIKYGLICMAVYCLSACSKMNATYIGFLKGGEILYLGKVDSLNAYPGKNRIKLTWLLPADPKVTRAKVFWNDKADSLEVVFPTPRQKAIDIMVNGLTDGSYTFEIYTYDNSGHKSIKVDTLVRAYGDGYMASLLGRPIKTVAMVSDSVTIKWFGSANGTFGEELSFIDNSGVAKTIFSPVGVDSTVLHSFKAGASFQFRTMYLPEPTAIDTFRTAYETQKVKGPPVDLSKAGWIAQPGVAPGGFPDWDMRAGASNRPPSYAIDNNPATVWVSRVATDNDYPHTMTVDMNGVVTGAAGFSFLQRAPLNGALKQVEIAVSQDNINWNSLGDFVLGNIIAEQFIEIPSLPGFRYFKIIGKSDYAASKNLALAEVGVYTQ